MSAIDALQRGGMSALLERLRGVGCRLLPRPTAEPAACDTLWSGEPERLHADGLFARGLRENSNLEQDWLWLSTIVSSEGELRYCLERALYINPHSDEAREELARLDRQHVARAAALRRCRA